MRDEDREDRPHDIKVTDRRMFTAEGELKEEYRWVEKGEASAEASKPEAPPEATQAETPESVVEPAEAEPTAAPPTPGSPLELPDTPDALGQPAFLDLLAVLAEPATIYLGDAALPDGRQAEDLRAARLYIDLLAVLRQKTNGNLTAQEQAVLDDLLYRLQIRYVEKRG